MAQPGPRQQRVDGAEHGADHCDRCGYAMLTALLGWSAVWFSYAVLWTGVGEPLVNAHREWTPGRCTFEKRPALHPMCSKGRHGLCTYRLDALVTLRNPNLGESWPGLITHRYPSSQQTDSKKALYQWWTQGLGFGGHVEQRNVSGPSGPSIVYQYTFLMSEGALRRALPCWYLEPFGHATPEHVKLSDEQASIGYTVWQVLFLFILLSASLFLWFIFIMLLRQTLSSLGCGQTLSSLGCDHFNAFCLECRNCICDEENGAYAELPSPAALATKAANKVVEEAAMRQLHLHHRSDGP